MNASTLRSPRKQNIDARYANTRFDSYHEDATGPSRWYFTGDNIGIFVTPGEYQEYVRYGRYFERFIG